MSSDSWQGWGELEVLRIKKGLQGFSEGSDSWLIDSLFCPYCFGQTEGKGEGIGNGHLEEQQYIRMSPLSLGCELLKVRPYVIDKYL